MVGTALAAAVTSGLAVLCSRSDVASVRAAARARVRRRTARDRRPERDPGRRRRDRGGARSSATCPSRPAPPCTSGCSCSPAAPGRRCSRSPPGRSAGTRPSGVRWPALYRELAAAARRPAGTGAAPPATATVGAVRETLVRARSRPRAERRGVPGAARRGRTDPPRDHRDRRAGRAARRGRGDRSRPGSSAPRSAARATCSPPSPTALADGSRRSPDETLEPARQRGERSAVDPLESAAELTRRAAAARLRALAGQLRAVVESTATGAAEGRRPGAGRRRRRARGCATRSPALRANLTPGLRGAAARGADGGAGRRLRPGRAARRLRARVLGVADGARRAASRLRLDVPARRAARDRARSSAWCVATELLHWIPGGDVVPDRAGRAVRTSACGWPARATSG